MKQAVIKLEKAIMGGFQGGKVFGFIVKEILNVAELKDLPEEYKKRKNLFHFCICDGKPNIVTVGLAANNIFVGDFITKKEWGSIYHPYLKECGEALHRIIKEKKREESWSGEEEFKI